MSEIDFKKINGFIEKNPKPAFCMVDEVEWRNALSGAMECLSEGSLEAFNTETFWSMIWTSAVYFCKGIMWAETKAGLREESFYPRY